MIVRVVMVGVSEQPVVYVIHSVGIRQGSHVGQGAPTVKAVGVVGQQSVLHGTVVLDTLMYIGQIKSDPGVEHESVGQAAFV